MVVLATPARAATASIVKPPIPFCSRMAFADFRIAARAASSRGLPMRAGAEGLAATGFFFARSIIGRDAPVSGKCTKFGVDSRCYHRNDTHSIEIRGASDGHRLDATAGRFLPDQRLPLSARRHFPD